MSHPSDTRIAALADAKDAALYFKYVLPLHPLQAFPESQRSLHGWQRVMRDLLPPEFLDGTKVHGLSGPVIDFITWYLMAFPDQFGVALTEEELQRRRVTDGPQFVTAGLALALAGNFSLDNIMVSTTDVPEDASGDPSITLTKLKLVDTSKISWDKLLELRRDETAAARLRDLRLCLVKEYENRDIHFVRDDLERRLENYDRTVRDWELDTRDSALTAIFSSKTFMASSGAMLAAVLAGGPLATVLAPAAAVGMTFEAAGILVDIRKRRRKLSDLKATDPVAYLVDTRKLEGD